MQQTLNDKFCSKHCAAVVNSKRFPKRGRAVVLGCEVCGNPRKSTRSRYCEFGRCKTVNTPKRHTRNACRSCDKKLSQNRYYCDEACRSKYKQSEQERKLREHASGRRLMSAWSVLTIQLALGLIERRCVFCKIDTWNDQPAPLEIDHINGNRHDNSINNLRWLCCNCHAQTPTWRGRKMAAR